MVSLMENLKRVTKEIDFAIYSLGIATMSLLFFSFFIGMIKLLAGFSVGGEDIYASLFISIVFLFVLARKKLTSFSLQIGIPVFAGLLLILLLYLCIYYEGNYFTMDWDSNTYHKSAVGFLKNGWNPVVESSENFCRRLFNNDNIDSFSIWIDHYPKATWIIGGQIYELTGNIESGKAYQLLGILAVFFLVLSYLIKKGYSWLASMSLSFLLSVNPISYVQILSYYVDGFMFSMFWVLLLGLIRWLDQEDDKREAWYLVVISMCILSNIKFTGLLYGGGILHLCISLLCIRKFYERQESNGLEENICMGRLLFWIGSFVRRDFRLSHLCYKFD